MQSIEPVIPVFLLVPCVAGFTVLLLVLGNMFNPKRRSRVKEMPYECGVDPIHDTRRRFDVRFQLLAIAFLVFDVELLFLYPWAVTAWPARAAASPNQVAAAEGPALTEVQQATVDALTDPDFPAGGDFVQNRRLIFIGVMVFVVLLALGFIYDWRKGIFAWR
jgi:NADH-quinone oxidoreductase subunit A